MYEQCMNKTVSNILIAGSKANKKRIKPSTKLQEQRETILITTDHYEVPYTNIKQK